MNNFTSTNSSSSNSSYVPPNRRNAGAGHERAQIRFNGNKPVGKPYRVRPTRKPETTQQTEKTDSAWTKAASWVQTQARSLQQAIKYVVISAPQDFPNSTTIRGYDLCVSGTEAAVLSIDTAFKREIHLLDVSGGRATIDSNASQAINDQLPNLGSTGEVYVSCDNGNFEFTSTVRPYNTTLRHMGVKQKIVSVSEYIVAQMPGILTQPFRAAKAGDNAVVSIVKGNTNDAYLIEKNQTGHFSGPGQLLNVWSQALNILSVVSDKLHIFQNAYTQSRDVPFTNPLGINHIDNQTKTWVQNTPTTESSNVQFSENDLQVFNLTTNQKANRTLDNIQPTDSRSMAEYGNGIWVYSRTWTNIADNTRHIVYDFVDVNLNSVIGGEKIIAMDNMYADPKPKVGVFSDGTVLMTYLDESLKKKHLTLLLVDDLPSPSFEIPSPIAPSPIIEPSPIAPSPLNEPTPTLFDIRNPSIIVFPPTNLNQTYTPITPEIIKLEGNLVNLTIVDKNGYEFVFNGNCSTVGENIPFTMTDLYNMSIALKNGTLKNVPKIEGCDAIRCVYAQSGLQEQFKLDDKSYVIWAPIIGGVVIILAIGGVVYYFKKVKPEQDEHLDTYKRKKQIDEKRARKEKDEEILEMNKIVAKDTEGQTFQGSKKFHRGIQPGDSLV